MSSTALSSPAHAEIVPFRPLESITQSSQNEEDRESPQSSSTTDSSEEPSGLPPTTLLKNTSASDAAPKSSGDQVLAGAPAVSAGAAEPMKINIPNLQAIEEHKPAPTEAEAESTAFKPIATDDDRPQQTVAEFKPLPWHSETTVQPTTEELAALSPSAGPDTPLIPMPEAAPTSEPPPPAPPEAAPVTEASPPAAPALVAALTATGTAAVPPALPALPPIQNPEAAAAKTPPDVMDKEATQALDQALRDKVELSAKTDSPQDLPKLESEVAKKETPKTPPVKRQAKEPAPAKPHSPLDTEPDPSLSSESEAIARRIPSNLDRPGREPAEEVTIDRARNLDDMFDDNVNVGKGGDVQAVQHEAMGIKIEVKNRDRNLDYELEKAYDALVTGQPSLAMEIYRNILTNDPNNKGALFGLATTYHRSGQLDQARSYYGKLLAIAPKHRDGLNNFLVLLADEAPEQALAKMEELAKRNPDFSPIPAQMAVIHQRLGNSEQATEHMFRAVALAPENMVYRYNLAIMLDKQKKYDEAARLYKQLIEAAGRGMTIPGNLQKIQQRLTFISSNRQ